MVTGNNMTVYDLEYRLYNTKLEWNCKSL